MILGDVCTRRCGFCAIETGRPLAIDLEEPKNVAKAAKDLGLKHVVITSVARDDMKDGGAGHFYETILAIRESAPETTIEVLTPDFKGSEESIEKVCEARPDIYNHNLETVERLTPFVRSPNAHYGRSLKLIQHVKKIDPTIQTKSGLMIGLGEQRDEVIQAFHDLKNHLCDIVTVGQYLQPTYEKLSVQEFIPLDVFESYEVEAKSLGFKEAFCGPYVRSSYHADEISEKVLR